MGSRVFVLLALKDVHKWYPIKVDSSGLIRGPVSLKQSFCRELEDQRRNVTARQGWSDTATSSKCKQPPWPEKAKQHIPFILCSLTNEWFQTSHLWSQEKLKPWGVCHTLSSCKFVIAAKQTNHTQYKPGPLRSNVALLVSTINHRLRDISLTVTGSSWCSEAPSPIFYNRYVSWVYSHK